MEWLASAHLPEENSLDADPQMRGNVLRSADVGFEAKAKLLFLAAAGVPEMEYACSMLLSVTLTRRSSGTREKAWHERVNFRGYR